MSGRSVQAGAGNKTIAKCKKITGVTFATQCAANPQKDSVTSRYMMSNSRYDSPVSAT